MLRSLKELEGYTVNASDGDIGCVKNFLLDDEHWVVRYLVVDTGGELGGLQVLISPRSFRQVDWLTNRFHLGLTVAKVRHSPNIDVDKPVSRQHEMDINRYYDFPPYWWMAGLLGTPAEGESEGPREAVEPTPSPDDVHLQSATGVRGYHIQGSDESIGRLQDFIVDDETWEVRYLAVDTSGWWFGKTVLVAPHWASCMNWVDRNITLELTRATVKDSPEWNPHAAINREYETHLYDYYGRPAYWASDAQRDGAVAKAQPLRPGG